MGNPYDDYVSLLLIYVMYYTMKSVCVIAVILPKNQKTSSNMSEKNITFEDLPKAMSWLMDKLNELDSKIDGLNNQNQSVPPGRANCIWLDELSSNPIPQKREAYHVSKIGN